MGFRIVKDCEERNRVEVINEPDWVFGLGSLENGVTPALQEGVALVVAFSIWSTPDREAAYEAIELAKAVCNRVRIGLLPYDYPDELSPWLSNTNWDETTIAVEESASGTVNVRIAQNNGTSPLWFELRNGFPRLISRGAMSTSEMRELLLAIETAGQ
jgi:hypothetical protein